MNKKKPTISSHPTCDPLVLNGPEGWLVVDPVSKTHTEVMEQDGHLSCSCFNAKTSATGECEHIRAVEIFRGHQINPPHPSQADADRYLDLLGQLDSELAENGQSAKQQHRFIDQWLEEETQRLNRRRRYLLSALEGWLHQQGRTHKNLVHGRLRIRNQPPQIKILDEDKVKRDQRFCREIPASQVIDKRVLRTYITRTGGAVEGVTVTQPPPKLYYQLREEVST